MVGHEEGVEAAALQRLRETLEMSEIEIGVRDRRRDSASRRCGWWSGA